MCDPVSISLGAISLGSQVVGQIEEAKARNKAAKASEADALRAFRATVSDIEAQRTEAAMASLQEVQNLRTASLQETGAVQAAQAESGVTGNTSVAVTNDLQRALFEALQANRTNLKLQNDQLDREIEGAAAGAQSRLNSALGMRANPFAVGLRIAGGAANLIESFRPRPGAS